MAAYPNLPTDIATSADGEDDAFQVDRMGDGTFRARVMFADKLPVNIVHPLIDDTEVATLEAFYAANRLTTFDYTYRGTTYSMMFGGKPKVRYATPTRYNVTVRLLPVA